MLSALVKLSRHVQRLRSEMENSQQMLEQQQQEKPTKHEQGEGQEEADQEMASTEEKVCASVWCSFG